MKRLCSLVLVGASCLVLGGCPFGDGEPRLDPFWVTGAEKVTGTDGDISWEARICRADEESDCFEWPTDDLGELKAGQCVILWSQPEGGMYIKEVVNESRCGAPPPG